jgi:hypothetical protein
MGTRTRGLLAVLIVLLLATGGSAVALSGRGGVHKDDLGNGIKKWIRRGVHNPKPTKPVPPGKTIRGVVGGDFHSFDPSGADFGVDVSLPVPAANPLGDDQVFVNVASDVGGATTTDTNAGCNGTPGNPTAPAGLVCIYSAGSDNANNLLGFSVLPGTGASPYGFKLVWECGCEGDTFVDGTWAYTAP